MSIEEFADNLSQIADTVSNAVDNGTSNLLDWAAVGSALIDIASSIVDGLEEPDTYDDDVPSIRE